MKEILSGIAQILGRIQSWRGFRGAILFVVDVDIAQKSFASNHAPSLSHAHQLITNY